MTSDSCTPQEVKLLLEAKKIHDDLAVKQARVAPAMRMAHKCDRLIEKFKEDYGINIRDSSAMFSSVPIELQPQALKDAAEIIRLEKITTAALKAILAEFDKEKG